MQKLNKKGITTGMISKLTLGLILLVVLFQVASTVVPTAQTAGTTLSNSGVPLGGLFGGDGGVVFIVIMAGILLAVITAFLVFGKK